MMETGSTGSFKQRPLSRTVALACLLGAAGVAHAAGTISMGDDQSISIGLGLRSSFSDLSNSAPNGTSRSSDFSVDSVRLLLGASLSKNVKLTFNTEKDSNGNVTVLDAYGEFQAAPSFNVDIGRTIIPSDRANLSGTYFMPSYTFASVASQFYSKFASRDDGAVIWGKVLNNKLVYSFGAFQGRNRTASLSNNDANLLYAGRLAVNFWDPEPAPAYFTSSTYYGAADIFTVGLVAQSQKNGVGTATVRGNYNAYGSDLLIEKKLAEIGVATIEGAFSKYSFNDAAATADGSVTPGKAGLVSLAYLFPQQLGWGKVQPFYRYQKFTPDAGFAGTKQNDLGVNYVIKGDSIKISATYTSKKTDGQPSINGIIIGTQLMF
jgi:hypothetical protein